MQKSALLRRNDASLVLYPPSMTLALSRLLALTTSLLAARASPTHENISNSPKLSVRSSPPYSLASSLRPDLAACSLIHPTSSAPRPLSAPNVSESADAGHPAARRPAAALYLC